MSHIEGGLSAESLSAVGVSPGNVTTDANGNITAIVLGEETYCFSYDYENRLIEARYPDNLVIEFVYDGLGRRTITRINGQGVRYVYDGYNVIQERDERTDELITEYTYLQGNVFKQKRGTQERWFYNQPEGGYTNHVFGVDGVKTDSLDFGWFGELAYHRGETQIALGWAGGWVFAQYSDMPFVLISKSNEIWLPKIGRRLNPLVAGGWIPPINGATGKNDLGLVKCTNASPIRTPGIEDNSGIKLPNRKCITTSPVTVDPAAPGCSSGTGSCGGGGCDGGSDDSGNGNGNGDGDNNGNGDTNPGNIGPGGGGESGLPKDGNTRPHPHGGEFDDYIGQGNPNENHEGFTEARPYRCPYIDQFHPNPRCWPPMTSPYHDDHVLLGQWTIVINNMPQLRFYSGPQRTSCKRPNETITLDLGAALEQCYQLLHGTEAGRQLAWTNPLCITLPKSACYDEAGKYWRQLLNIDGNQQLWAQMNYLFLVHRLTCRGFNNQGNPNVYRLTIPRWNPMALLATDVQFNAFSECTIGQLSDQYHGQCR